MLAFIAWWLVMQVFGLAALPLTRRVFARLPDQGYAFSKPTGLLLVSYLLWIGANSGLLVNDAGGILLALAAAAGLSLWFGRPRARLSFWADLSAFWKAQKGSILTTEVLFALAFAGWVLVRAYTPDKILPLGGEKYMEIAFLNGILNSPQFPPLDPWMAGYGISYYYFGYVMMAVMVTASSAAATVGFDLYDALMFALAALGAFGVVSNMVRASGGGAGAARGFGLLGSLFTVGMGNLQGLLEGLYSSRALPDGFWSWLSIPDLAGAARSGSFYPGHNWWWWRASRVLQDTDLFYKPVIYPPIDEFPFFSFLLGDNHPHKMALPFVLLALGLAFTALLEARDGAAVRAGLGGWRAKAVPFAFTALVLGGLAFLNTWDFPVLLGLVVLARMLGAYRPGPDASKLPGARFYTNTLVYALGLAAASAALYVFFYLGFASQAGGVLPYIFPPTRLPQYLVMFGPFVLILAVFAVSANARAGREAWRNALRVWAALAGGLVVLFLLVLLAGMLALPLSGSLGVVSPWLGKLTLQQAFLRILQVKAANPWLFLLLTVWMALALSAVFTHPEQEDERSTPHSRPDATAQFALLLGFAGLGLTLAVEFFYLRDNFGLRMNTIFKFYFQAWTLMACASAYAIWWTARRLSPAARGAFLLAAGLLTAAGLTYTVMGVTARVEGFRNAPNLDAAATFAGFYPNHWAASPDDYAAVRWLQATGRLPDGSPPVLLEAGSISYEIAGRIAAFTGFPSLLGWTNHEGQWRGTQQQIEARAPVIRSIYTTPSAQAALELLNEWQVNYVILGEAERQYIASACRSPEKPCQTTRALEKFDQFLEPVFVQGTTTIYRVPAAASP